MKHKIVIIDYLHEGHHAVYASVLLRGLLSAGYEVLFIGTPDLIEQIINIVKPEKNIEFVFIKARVLAGHLNEINKLLTLKDSIKTIIKFKPDVVHFLQLDRFLLGISIIRFFLNNTQIVSTLHWCSLILDHRITLKSLVNKFLFRHLLRKSKIITHSRSTNLMVRNAFKSNLYYAPYPIHFTTMNCNNSLNKKFTTRKELGLTESDKLLLCFGGARYDKGLDLAIEALTYLDSSYHLLIAGKEEDFSEAVLMEQAECHGVSNRIFFKMFFIEEEKVVDFFCASDFVLVPYKITFSGQSGPLVFAASIGVPVIGSSAPVISETINDYQLGEIFAPYNAFALASAIKSCKQGYRNFNPFVKDHSPDIFCDHVIKAYSLD